MQVVQPLFSAASIVFLLGLGACGDSSKDGEVGPDGLTFLERTAIEAAKEQPKIEGRGDYVSPGASADTLMRAAREGNAEMVKLLIGEGADVDAALPDGLCSLHVAVAGGHMEVVKVLLENNANPNPRQAAGATPLLAAMRLKDLELIKLLLNNRADPTIPTLNDWFPLYLFDQYKWDLDAQVELAELLLAAGADVNQRMTQSKNTALMGYASSGNTKMVQWLISKGADINAKGDKGYAPLAWSAIYNRLETARILINAGADLSITNDSGATPREIAEDTKQEIAGFLKQQEARQAGQ